MNALPSMIVLDFCEWLKNHSQQHNENYNDIFDLILNEKYSSYLEYLAKEYLNGGDHSFRALLHHFIDSEEFEECQKCHRFLIDDCQYQHKSDSEEIYMFLHHCYRCEQANKAFRHFIKRYYSQNSRDFQYHGNITPEMLADSVKHYINYQRDEPFVLKSHV